MKKELYAVYFDTVSGQNEVARARVLKMMKKTILILKTGSENTCLKFINKNKEW